MAASQPAHASPGSFVPPSWTHPRRALRAAPTMERPLAAPAPEPHPEADRGPSGPPPLPFRRPAADSSEAAPGEAAAGEDQSEEQALAAAKQVAAVVAFAIAEALRGLRTVTQLGHHLDPATFRKVERRVRWERETRELARQPLDPGALRPLSCHVQLVSSDACECSASLLAAGRVRALCFRLELVRGRWRCVEVEIG